MKRKKSTQQRSIFFSKMYWISQISQEPTNYRRSLINTFSAKESNEVYIVQDHKNKDATGVLVDMRRYAEERKDDVADIPLRAVIEDDGDVDYEYIFDNLDKIDIED
ncbi:hypothetical protein [Lentibacillus salicampi]|uniref:Uncharacterized protein n=1 Tax=Lentibacillus salicampi TaxID=175306 RepID=A0A4Y9AG95_9BACI|nr:hypothetical protein [Lentibacillus salicampi]TFJ94392.1 hypothetical protein E4U82_00300 [Lentibacillus salicampi]